MPHLLIAGTTGSGKSVCLNSIVCSILYRMQPEQVKFIMIDPKRVELNVYRDVPHLLAPVVCEARKASAALTWAVEQMEERYKRLAALGVRNIDGYNAIVRSSEPHPKAIGRRLEYMPHIVIVVDELADLMLIARNEVEDNVIRLAQMSRAVGMHLIIATQRPSVNVITGIIKANFPSRIAFQVSSKVDSRTILDGSGAEALLGKGDMLFSSGGSQKPVRLQGCYVSDEEVERVADYVRGQQQAQYLKQDFVANKNEEVGNPALSLDGIDADESKVPMPGDDDADDYDFTYQQSRGAGGNGSGGERSARVAGDDSDSIDEELFRQAIKLILVHRKASVSMLQRKLKIGFARAGRVMDMIEEAGVVGPSEGSKVREIIVDPDEYLAQMESKESDRF
jgi:S-DNA-T family DNA segregation ATPase FtsK/SpoIIIE